MMIYVLSALLVLGVLINLCYALINGSSIQGTFSMFNQIQLYMLLPLIGAYMPNEVVLLIAGMSTSLFSFDFLPIGDIKSLSSVNDLLSYPQYNPYLYLYGLEDSSALINLSAMLSVSLAVPALHSVIVLVKLLFRKSSLGDKNKCRILVNKFFDWLTFGWYIRLVMETYLLMLFASF